MLKIDFFTTSAVSWCIWKVVTDNSGLSLANRSYHLTNCSA